MARLQKAGDTPALAELVYESIYRHQGDIANPNLYNVSLVGTKQIIEDYLLAVEQALDYVVDTSHAVLDDDRKRGMLQHAEHNLGQSALLLSGGASMGFFHLGVVKAMCSQAYCQKPSAGPAWVRWWVAVCAPAMIRNCWSCLMTWTASTSLAFVFFIHAKY